MAPTNNDLSDSTVSHKAPRANQTYLKFMKQSEQYDPAKTPRFGEISKSLTLRAWRPFDGVYPEHSRRAQDMLGAINFLGVVLFNISKIKT
jgi:hypothetical protein